MWCSGGCSLKCYKTFTFSSLLTRCTIPCACRAKRHLNLQKWSEALVFLTFWLGNVLRATTARTFSTSQLPKVVRAWCALHILTSKCASRHNGVHFFDISTSKSGPSMVCFAHFDFEMCFLPQRRALFRHLNFQKWSEGELFFSFFTCKCASHHNGVQFFSLIWPHGSAPAALASLLFDPPATNHWKNTVFGDFPTFSRWIFFLLRLSLFVDLLSSSLLFSSLTLPTCAFPSVHIVGSLTSKLLSIMKHKKCLKPLASYVFLHQRIGDGQKVTFERPEWG